MLRAAARPEPTSRRRLIAQPRPVNRGQLGCRQDAGEIHAASSSPTSNGTDRLAIPIGPQRTTVNCFPRAPG